MNTRIKIYCILLAAIYIGMFAYQKDYMIESFMDGCNSTREERVVSVNLDLKSKEEPSFHVINNKNGENISIKVSDYKMTVSVPPNSLPAYLIVLYVLLMIVIMFCGLLLLAFPFIFFNVVYNITKNRIATESVIVKIRILGWTLIAFFIMSVLFEYVETSTVDHLVDLSDYKIKYPDLDVYIISFSLGLVTLLLADILKHSLSMKEEQDLII